MKLSLYRTRYCHLCEQAEALLHEARLQVEYIDITEDDALLERYSLRIPVIRRVDNGAELDWPFDRRAIIALTGSAPDNA